jgi:FlgD Ig-like domain
LRRVFTTVTLLGLLVLTAAAFAITEHLKLIKSPIFGTEILNGRGVATKVFSPVCNCPNSKVRIRIRLRHKDHVTVTIVDADGHKVATLASGEAVSAHSPHHFVWDGSTAEGTRAPDGVYHPWVYLAHERHTFEFTNNIAIDTKPPRVVSVKVAHPTLFAGPGRTVAITYAFNEPAHPVVYLGNRRIIVGRRLSGDKVKWAGTVGGSPLRSGTYVLSVGARDKAGNETPAAQRKDVKVVVRYVGLAPGQVSVRGGSHFNVRVKTAAPRFSWRLGLRHGTQRGRLLRLRAPTTAGTYRLVVTENGQSSTAVVRVHG